LVHKIGLGVAHFHHLPAVCPKGTGGSTKGKKLETVEPGGLTVAATAKRAKKETPREAEPLKEPAPFLRIFSMSRLGEKN
jgi:hypothetical protein